MANIEGRFLHYEDERQWKAEVAGRMKTKFVVSPEGSVIDTRVMESKTAGEQCERCILSGISAMFFRPRPMVEPRPCAIRLFLRPTGEVSGNQLNPAGTAFGV